MITFPDEAILAVDCSISLQEGVSESSPEYSGAAFDDFMRDCHRTRSHCGLTEVTGRLEISETSARCRPYKANRLSPGLLYQHR